ncbi:hypothetical protein NL676_002763 [Syzygium grande]|nr:hypothetical protein NL676_002763 [Syzygium grande]
MERENVMEMKLQPRINIDLIPLVGDSNTMGGTLARLECKVQGRLDRDLLLPICKGGRHARTNPTGSLG